MVVGAGAEFEGLLSLRRPGRIEGEVKGDVIAAASLWIGPGGCVRGRVEADEVIVDGRLEGEVHARGRIELRRGARVRADLSAPRLILADGSFFEGQCQAGSPGSEG